MDILLITFALAFVFVAAQAIFYCVYALLIFVASPIIGIYMAVVQHNVRLLAYYLFLCFCIFAGIALFYFN